MKMYIQLVDGEPVEHPILEENFKEFLNNFDPNILPENWAVFERIEQPRPGIYEIVEHTGYKWDGNVVKDTWNIRPMTKEEKEFRQNSVKKAWAENGISKTWVFNDEICSYEPPVPYPTDGRVYEWDEEKQNWKVMALPKPLLEEE